MTAFHKYAVVTLGVSLLVATAGLANAVAEPANPLVGGFVEYWPEDTASPVNLRLASAEESKPIGQASDYQYILGGNLFRVTDSGALEAASSPVLFSGSCAPGSTLGRIDIVITGSAKRYSTFMDGKFARSFAYSNGPLTVNPDSPQLYNNVTLTLIVSKPGQNKELILDIRCPGVLLDAKAHPLSGFRGIGSEDSPYELPYHMPSETSVGKIIASGGNTYDYQYAMKDDLFQVNESGGIEVKESPSTTEHSIDDTITAVAKIYEPEGAVTVSLTVYFTLVDTPLELLVDNVSELEGDGSAGEPFRVPGDFSEDTSIGILKGKGGSGGYGYGIVSNQFQVSSETGEISMTENREEWNKKSVGYTISYPVEVWDKNGVTVTTNIYFMTSLPKKFNFIYDFPEYTGSSRPVCKIHKPDYCITDGGKGYQDLGNVIMTLDLYERTGKTTWGIEYADNAPKYFVIDKKTGVISISDDTEVFPAGDPFVPNNSGYTFTIKAVNEEQEYAREMTLYYSIR